MTDKLNNLNASPSSANGSGGVEAGVPLESIRIFEAAARHLGFTAAAAELNVTQSAVSQRIKALEVALGVKLFERRPNGLRLTEAGQSYLLDIRPAIQRLRAATRRAAFRSSLPSSKADRTLAVGTTQSIALLCLMPHFASFRSAFPDVSLKIETATALVDPAEAGLDCAIRYGPGQWTGVIAGHLAGETLTPICAPELLEPARQALDLSELANYPLVHDLGPISWVEWLNHFGAAQTVLPEVLNVSESSLAVQAALDGAGVALGRSQLVRQGISRGRLIAPTPYAMASPFDYYMVSSPQRSRDTLLAEFRHWLSEQVFPQNI
ncbi:MAG: LysR family transcriptional regulator [Rhodobacteraceae bacterium]|nr:MAG: LysR family transcriptional regulator [Paracoccaceae bacterium]